MKPIKPMQNIDDITLILNSKNLPIKIIGREKNNDKNKGININANGIKNLKNGSNVSEYAIQ